MKQIKLEFTSSAKEFERLIGILAIPRISRNGNLYLLDELARADGITVPVLRNHQELRNQSGKTAIESSCLK